MAKSTKKYNPDVTTKASLIEDDTKTLVTISATLSVIKIETNHNVSLKTTQITTIDNLMCATS